MSKERIHLTPLNLSADVSEGSSEPSKASPGKQTAHEQVRVRKQQGFEFRSSGSKTGLEPTLGICTVHLQVSSKAGSPPVGASSAAATSTTTGENGRVRN